MNLLSNTLGLIIFIFAAAWPSQSLFQLNNSWTSDRGKLIKLESFAGKPTLITFIYTHCATACPVTVRRLIKVNDAAKEQNLSLQIVLISMDTARDTPKRLNEFRAEQKLSDGDWSLLSGTEEDVRALSVALGFSYQKVEDSDEILHSNRLVLLNEAGEIKQTFDGLNTTAEEIVAQVKVLQES